MIKLQRALITGTIAAVLTITGTACGQLVEVDNGSDIETSTSPELIKEATDYGGWTLPPDGKVLLAQREIVRDIEYKLAVEMSPAELS